jgi:uncharacterized protein (TIGR02145 family)
MLKDGKNFVGGLNTDDAPNILPSEDYTDALNVRTLSSSEQHGVGIAETLQGEIPILLNVSADIITYYGEAIGGNFVYAGYEEVTIGTQVWMKKNWNENYPGSKAYDNDLSNVDVYGRLYTWNQAINEDFCPLGWHVPTTEDIDTLLTFLGGELIAGGKLKEPGDLHWTLPNTDANDSSGFKALPGGKFDLLFSLLGEQGLLWIADEAVPPPPVADPATEITYDSFLANWQSVVGVDGYYLDVSTDINFGTFVAGYHNKAVGNVLNASVTGLVAEETYYYRVRAYNDIGSSENSNVITVDTLVETVPYLLDKDANQYTTIVIGTQEWVIENLKTTTYADGTPIPNLVDYNDYYLGSKDENNLMYVNLHLFGVGNFENLSYWSSSEVNATEAYAQLFLGGVVFAGLKSLTLRARPIRRFTSATVYAIRDIGPAGGRIFYKDGNNYLEAATEDILLPSSQMAWSNVSNVAIGTTSTAVGTGQANTTKILAQAGHIVSAAKQCDEITGSLWAIDVAGAYCWYDNDIAYKNPYGALYNWYAVDNLRGLVYFERAAVQEVGWRVPTAADWAVLATYLGGYATLGGKLKEMGLSHWLTPNTGATDEIGFIALPAGYRENTHGNFIGIYEKAYFWASNDPTYSTLMTNIAATLATFSSLSKNYGFSVRCVRDYAHVVSPQYVILSDGANIIRKGVRNSTFVVDMALTLLGFAGTESTNNGVTGDWKNLITW